MLISSWIRYWFSKERPRRSSMCFGCRLVPGIRNAQRAARPQQNRSGADRLLHREVNFDARLGLLPDYFTVNRMFVGSLDGADGVWLVIGTDVLTASMSALFSQISPGPLSSMPKAISTAESGTSRTTS